MSDEPKLAFLAGAALFLELLDTSLLSNLIVPLAQSFDVHERDISSAILGYTIGSSLLISAVAWLCKKYSQVKLLMLAMIGFLLSSASCGLAEGLVTFTLARFVQGISISFAAPVAMIMLMEKCNEERIPFYVSIVNMPALIGIAIGPLVGGLCAHYANWRYSFYINIPISLMLMCFIYTQFKHYSFKTKNKNHSKFDISGFIYSSSCILLLSLSVQLSTQQEILLSIFTALIGITSLVLFFRTWKKKRAQCLLNLAVFFEKNYQLGTITNCIVRIGLAGMPVALSIYLHQHFQFTLIQTGAYLATISLMAAVSKLSTNFFGKIGLENSILLTSLGGGLSVYAVQFMEPEFYSLLNITILLSFGFFKSTVYSCMNGIMLINMRKEDMGDACNIQSIIQQLFEGFGIIYAIYIPFYFKEHLSNKALAFQYYGNLSLVITLSSVFVVFFCKRKNKLTIGA